MILFHSSSSGRFVRWATTVAFLQKAFLRAKAEPLTRYSETETIFFWLRGREKERLEATRCCTFENGQTEQQQSGGEKERVG